MSLTVDNLNSSLVAYINPRHNTFSVQMLQTRIVDGTLSPVRLAVTDVFLDAGEHVEVIRDVSGLGEYNIRLVVPVSENVSRVRFDIPVSKVYVVTENGQIPIGACDYVSKGFSLVCRRGDFQ